MAEFVDNALQSHLQHRDALADVDDSSRTLRVSIDLDARDDGQVSIRDNAAGIYESEYARAFRPAEVPPNSTGLCEFGMGMKSAACWFAENWSVRTTAFGEPVEHTIVFHISRIVQDRLEELAIKSRQVPRHAHYTEIKLTGMHKPLHGRNSVLSRYKYSACKMRSPTLRVTGRLRC